MTKKRKIGEILKRLSKAYRMPMTALKFRNPFELLVATILSAQATDAHINKVTDELFRKYRDINDFAACPLSELQNDLSSVNFYKNKSKSIQGAAREIIDKYGSEVPASMEELIKLPGIARKTANVILSNAFGINEGIAVDTHVKRLSGRLGLSEHTDPVRIEQDLMKETPQKEWSALSHLLIFHGRQICKARNPDHENCQLFDICPSNSD
ncbi:MAG: endonuclease III [Nitrospirota bacterium]|nr:MAG: endonuclease III [Nitrospirota bacterium]